VNPGFVEQLLSACHRATMLVHHAARMIVVTPVIHDVNGPEEFADIRHRRSEAVMIVALSGAEPWPVQIKNFWRKRNALGIKPKRVVDSDIEVLRRKRDRAASGIVAGQKLRPVIENLGGEDALLEGHDLRYLFGGRCSLCLRMDQRSGTGL